MTWTQEVIAPFLYCGHTTNTIYGLGIVLTVLEYAQTGVCSEEIQEKVKRPESTSWIANPEEDSGENKRAVFIVFH